MSMKAIWNGAVIAESDDTAVVEGNHYFPSESLVAEHFQPSRTKSVCPWKGVAIYYTVTVGGDVNTDAAWEYLKPLPAARAIKGRVAFWNGVRIVANDATERTPAR